MDRSPAIGRLGAQLDAAASGADWDALARAVHGLARQLQALAVKGPWSAAERAALQRLRASHERAAQAGAAAAAGLQARMDEMRDNKEGWMAYALAGATEPGENVR
ncbi:hypothetical protein IFT68_03935 [Oxalobacteraceae sp. CFBP 13730]|jgi:hypothetical protein|nr:hypothetical protein [Oxalobacteraceae sp. CFBP 13730]